MRLTLHLGLVIAILLAAPDPTEAANPSEKDLKSSNFRELLRGGSSTLSPKPDNPAPLVSSAPSGSTPSRVPFCDEVPGGPTPAAGGSQPPTTGTPTGSSPSGSPSANGPMSTAPASNTSSTPSGSGGSPAAGGGSPPSAGGSGDGKSPTYEQFCAAIDSYSKTSAGGNPPKPSKEIYNAFIKYVSATMPLKEQAMFLANSIWETGGLQFMKEIACSNGSCAYGKYYGRGFIQLTWDYNYREASKDIFGNDSLFNNPDIAATPEGAWQTALWFWNKRVAPVLKEKNAVETYKLGYSIKVINGGLECPANQKAQNRMAIYNEILAAWNIDKNKPGKMEGC